MRAFRALNAILLAAVTAAGALGVFAQDAVASTEVCGQDATELRRVQPLPDSDAFLASSTTTSLAGPLGESVSSEVPAPRTVRPQRTASLVAPAARIAAVQRDCLDFAHRLTAARLGWFCFGSTAPPPFRI